MKAAKEAVRSIKTMEELIRIMKLEIDYLRILVVRYQKYHGKKVYPLPVDDLSDDMDFLLKKENDESTTLDIIKGNELQLVSRYQKIVEAIESLEQ